MMSRSTGFTSKSHQALFRAAPEREPVSICAPTGLDFTDSR
jgi:hypothetical protein